MMASSCTLQRMRWQQRLHSRSAHGMKGRCTPSCSACDTPTAPPREPCGATQRDAPQLQVLLVEPCTTVRALHNRSARHTHLGNPRPAEPRSETRPSRRYCWSSSSPLGVRRTPEPGSWSNLVEC